MRIKTKKIKKSKKKQNVIQNIPIVRYQTDKEFGLSEEQINERIEHHLVNDTKIKTSNSYLTIVRKNIFTFFNLIWMVIAIALMCVGAWSDLIFLFVVIANTAIAIFQEIKSKNTVERLSMVSVPKIKVIRMGFQHEVKGENLLLDDIIILENGNQIPTDCIIIDGEVEANESLLTGESNSIKKKEGNLLLAGSFLVSGMCYARVDKVGKQNYIQTVAERTKDFKPQTSNLFKDLNNLIKIITLILIPVGVLTFCKEYLIAKSTIEDSITSTSGALTGMIPAGMYLLITVGLSVGVMKLASKKTLVKNIYSIEMLARANVLCLDKTGTITDGTMNVVEVVTQNNRTNEQIEKIMKAVLANQKTSNATSVALIDHFGKNLSAEAKEVVEFSSQRKYSATTLKDGKTYYIGATGFIKCAISAAQKKLMESYMEQGYRVISLVEDDKAYNEKTAGKTGKILAFFILEDHIRKDAVETISWFKENNVEIKIISGDDALTVSKIAKRVGVLNSEKYVSLENMSLTEVAQIANKFTVFGRVTPEQKHTIIKALKTQGNVVAMTGDGVNDTLALKEANCSIAMADGSEVARNISHIVLMESNFSALPSIVREGRKIVNNVQYSSVLYLMKTLFTILLCVTTLILGISYPFTPKQMLLLEMFVIGLPSFILTFQPNKELIRGDFIPQVLKKSIPCALVMFINILIVVLLNRGAITLSEEEYTSLCTLLLTCVGFVNLVWISMPMTLLRGVTVGISGFLIVSSFVSGLARFFRISEYTFPVVVTLITLVLCTSLLIYAFHILARKIDKKYLEKLGIKTKSQTGTKIWNKLSHIFDGKNQGKKKNKTDADILVESIVVDESLQPPETIGNFDNSVEEPTKKISKSTKSKSKTKSQTKEVNEAEKTNKTSKTQQKSTKKKKE